VVFKNNLTPKQTVTFLNPNTIRVIEKRGFRMALCIIGQEKSETNISLLEEAKKRFDSVFFAPVESIRIGLSEKFSVSYRASDLMKFDAIYPRIPSSYYSYAYQLLSLLPPETFTPIRPITFLLASERFFLLSVLRKRGIDTINLNLARSQKAAHAILEESKFPLVIRIPGKETGVVVETLTEAKSVIDALGSLKQRILIEDLVKDMVSVYVAQPDVLTSVKKKSKEKDPIFSEGEFRKHKIDLEIEHLALETAKAIDTQIARIDISVNSGIKIVNVGLTPDLITPSKVTNINLPKEVISHIYESYKVHKEKPLLMKFFEDAKSVVKDVLKGKHMVM
jgi:glutathione synthase/RimK-type ligase-like ATP-grasp enzyme